MSSARLLSTLLIGLAAAAGCGGEPTGVHGSPEGPRPAEDPSRSALIFDGRALSRYPSEDRAYVMGHAFGVYLFARTLPAWIAPSGYKYQAGKSSRFARVGYDYLALVTDTPAPVERATGCYQSESDGEVCPEQDEPPDDDEGEDEGEPPVLDEDCETFLDPAAMQARELRRSYDVEEVLNEGMTVDEIADHRDGFELGFADSLGLEDLDEETDFSEAYAMQEHAQDAGLCEHSPLVLDLLGDGVAASSPQDGVLFDLQETGTPVQTAWPAGDDALLAMDRDGDGVISNGGELFGASLARNDTRYQNGFQALAELDRAVHGGNADGRIDARDRLFAKLVLWRDADRDGISADEELATLAAEHISAIGLEHRESSKRDLHGNRLGLWGTFRLTDAKKQEHERPVVDVWFRIRVVAPSLLD